MQHKYLNPFLYTAALLLLSIPALSQQRLMEKLNRGLVALESDDGVFLSWRRLATDPEGISYQLYRNDSLITPTPLTAVTNYLDATGASDQYYHLEVLTDAAVRDTTDAVVVWGNGYKEIPLQTPEGYQPNDASVADLDGDGDFEIVVKFERESRDNSQSGFTDPVYLHAYKMNGTLLWSIDLGINIRAGAHYTQFMVYDLDGDGLAEVVCKTAPGTRDATGEYLSDGIAGDDDDAADYRNDEGYILEGPEYLTLFSGMTGEEVSTVEFNPVRGNVGDWGDTYGNRVDRFLAGVAYFDRLPSVVMARGYYTRSVLTAWDYVDGELVQRWVFDTDSGGTGKDGNAYSLYTGQGAHSLSVGDIDQDGKDEIMYGAMAVDDDGVGLYVTGNNHGDATHLGDFLPDRPGLEYFMPSESAFSTNRVTGETVPAIYLTDASDGTVLWQKDVTEKADIGRAMVADVSAATKGAEFWASSGFGVYDADGNQIDRTSGRPSINFGSWWDGDLQRELLDRTTITKWTPDTETALLSPEGVESNNGTKATPALSGDILGDWREEVIWRTSDNQALRIYSTTIPTDHSLYTLLQDPQYRVALTWQNVGYNQPPHPSFYLGGEMEAPPMPNIAMAMPTGEPSIQITNPVVGQTNSQGSTLYATVSIDGFDDGTIVYLSSDDVLLASDTVAPYVMNLDTLPSGTYSLIAWAYTADSTLVQSTAVSLTIDLGAPSIMVTSPDAGRVFSITDMITLTADATDPNGTVEQVAFYIGENEVATVDSPPYSAEVDNPGYGIYDVWAVVTDNDGLKDTSALRSISVGQGTIIQESEMAFCGFLNLGTIDSDNEGFTGDGFANTENQVGEGVSWAITIPATGDYQMLFRYASQGQRDAMMSIGEIVTDETVTFPPSESWTSWTTTATNVVNLPAGNYEVTLTATTGSGLGNIDYLQVLSFSEAAAQGLDCAELSTSTSAIDAARERISVYPVPSFGTVNFELHNPDAQITRLTLYGYTGRQVLTREYATQKAELDVSRMKPGMYLAELETSSGRKYTKRVVIN
ncbi:Ig-like domain-containing protein [Lewinella sp. IMCC34183]|uniref:rhamnogalacturonan lyase family protein n=1 Tax=Lewinella sp. IMCC34183 TaxID=2248762 RepID=UPI000E287886|nr:Ig-like domain-containing protein [Lewinella sp. IMCC34183]